MKKKFILVLTFVALPLLAQNFVQLTNEQKETIITFKLDHLAHTTFAESNQLQIKIEYDKDKTEIIKAIAQVKVISFNSGNSNRDSHAMELIEANKFPMATF
ncbi:MAG: YceI family protein [Candidatus Kapaibacteriales bacterium]